MSAFGAASLLHCAEQIARERSLFGAREAPGCGYEMRLFM